jgi:hypothetical protein
VGDGHVSERERESEERIEGGRAKEEGRVSELQKKRDRAE